MKAIVATCFESNEERAGFVCEALRNKGYESVVLTTDFSHIRKEKRETAPEGFRMIETLGYKRNLSVQRMRSHGVFAKDLFTEIAREDPDLIWLMIPANSLVREAERYRESHPDTGIVIDVIDMWPESLPLSIRKDLLPFRIWKNVRASHLNCADALVSECDLYQEILRNEYDREIRTIRWARDSRASRENNVLPDDRLVLCYIGSINNIIDTARIAGIVSKIDRPVLMHVIGEGENTERFLNDLQQVCEVIYHGPIRDEEKKAEIFRQCHAGINVYREGLYIGLTVKCIDYFAHGLPIVNNIKGDTWKLVEEHQAGINVREDDRIDADELIRMRKDSANIYELYDENFTKEVFVKACSSVIDEVMK